MALRDYADKIIREAIRESLPDNAVRQALKELPACSGRLILVAVGKAAWQMADTACRELGEAVTEGIVITKYGHSKGEIGNVSIYEAGHPVPDQNGYSATQRVLELTDGLCPDDIVLFLLSGGGSALFESPLVPPARLEEITEMLLAGGADINEINTLRKHLSAVKGGRFALHCAPAHVFAVVLSDVLGDSLETIASGPACPDSTTGADALKVAEKYWICLSEEDKRVISRETPKALSNVTTLVTGSVRQLCHSAEKTCRRLGYQPLVLTSELCCEAREAGRWLASMAESTEHGRLTAFIAGGETVVHVKGQGKGGRNQELVLSAARGIRGLKNTALFSVGSDGTDGPTDAAGAFADGTTAQRLEKLGFDINDVLDRNDSYTALKAADALIFTGPTGTNVNDFAVLLVGDPKVNGSP